MSPRLHRDEHLLDAGQPELETVSKVLMVDRELALYAVEQFQIAAEQPYAFVGNRRITPSPRPPDSERMGELQLMTALLPELNSPTTTRRNSSSSWRTDAAIIESETANWYGRCSRNM